MSILDVERLQLPSKLTFTMVVVDRVHEQMVRVVLAVGALLYLTFKASDLVFLSKTYQQPQSVLYLVGMIIVAALLIWWCVVCCRTIRHITDSADPGLVLTREGFTLGDVTIPWSRVNALHEKVVAEARKIPVVCAIAEIQNIEDLPVTFFKNELLQNKYNYYKKRYKIDPTTLMIPLFMLDRQTIEMMVLLQRYWCEATARWYSPQSLEIIAPQKKFSDFKK